MVNETGCLKGGLAFSKKELNLPHSLAKLQTALVPGLVFLRAFTSANL